METSEMQWIIEKKSLVPEKIRFELFALKSPSYGENTCHHESMC